MNNTETPAAPRNTEDQLVGRVRGGSLPRYDETDSLRLRIAKCIAFELQHGGDAMAAADALLRDIEWGYIHLPNVPAHP